MYKILDQIVKSVGENVGGALEKHVWPISEQQASNPTLYNPRLPCSFEVGSFDKISAMVNVIGVTNSQPILIHNSRRLLLK